jgi:hypothetical protein
MRVYYARRFTKARRHDVFEALRKDSYLRAIVNAAFLVDARKDHAALLIANELKRRGHHRTPNGMSCYTFSSIRVALIGWPQ